MDGLAQVIAFLREGGILAAAVILGAALYFGKLLFKRESDALLKAKDDLLASERAERDRERTALLAQIAEWKAQAESSDALADKSSDRVEEAAEAVKRLAAAFDGFVSRRR